MGDSHRWDRVASAESRRVATHIIYTLLGILLLSYTTVVLSRDKEDKSVNLSHLPPFLPHFDTHNTDNENIARPSLRKLIHDNSYVFPLDH